VLNSTIQEVDEAERIAQVFVGRHGGNEDDAHAVGMTVRELVINSMIYVNGFDTQKTVELRLYSIGRKIVGYVEDADPANIDGAMEHFMKPSSKEQILLDHGKGFMMVAGFTHEEPRFVYLKDRKKIRFARNISPSSR
jgi:hypothetical protein